MGCRDSLSLRDFLGYGLAKNLPDHSTLSKTCKRLSLQAHVAVFGCVLKRLREYRRCQPAAAQQSYCSSAT